MQGYLVKNRNNGPRRRHRNDRTQNVTDGVVNKHLPIVGSRIGFAFSSEASECVRVPKTTDNTRCDFADT